MKVIRSAWETVIEFRRAYIVLNAVYYGLVLCGMIYVAFNPALQQTLMQAIGRAFVEGPLAAVGSAYTGGQVIQAAGLTFVVNLVVGSILEITLPSLVIPFSGLLIGVYRAILWGLLLSPAAPELRLIMIPHSITLILEGQGYILAMLAAYAQGRAFLWPRSVGVEGHLKGYGAGVKRTLCIYLLVVIVLAAAAIYEAIEVILMTRLMGAG